LREAPGKDHIWVAIRCSPFHTASAFHPIIEHLKRVFGWQPEDTAQQHLAKLEAGLDGFRTLPRSESVQLFADLMSVPMRGPLSAPLNAGLGLILYQIWPELNTTGRSGHAALAGNRYRRLSRDDNFLPLG
jgi:hypothetical protein